MLKNGKFNSMSDFNLNNNISINACQEIKRLNENRKLQEVKIIEIKICFLKIRWLNKKNVELIWRTVFFALDIVEMLTF